MKLHPRFICANNNDRKKMTTRDKNLTSEAKRLKKFMLYFFDVTLFSS